MYLSKASIDITSHLDPNDKRPVLSGVYVTDSVSVATDAYRLLRVNHPVIDPSEVPTDLYITSERDAIIPASALIKAKANMPKKHIIDALNVVSVSVDIETDRAQLVTTDLDTVDTVKTRIIEGRYPDYTQIIPKEDDKPTVKIAINAKYLKEMAAYFEKHTEKDNYIEIEVYKPTESGADRALIMRAKVGADQEALGLIMPLKRRPEPTPEPEATPEATPDPEPTQEV